MTKVDISRQERHRVNFIPVTMWLDIGLGFLEHGVTWESMKTLGK